jgi:hypothetical protein
VGALASPADVIGNPKGKLQTLGSIPAFDPRAHRWDTIAAPPTPLAATQLIAFWTGTRLIVIGIPPDTNGPGAHGVGFAYDPGSDRWTAIAPAPAGRALGDAYAWTGDRLLTWAFGAGVSSYDPAADTWTAIDDEHLTGTQAPHGPTDPPVINTNSASAAWTGSELVVADRSTPKVAAFDPATRTWRALPDHPVAGAGPLVWTGTRLGLGDVQNPSWIGPHDAQWQHSKGPISGPGAVADVWADDRFLAFASIPPRSLGSQPPASEVYEGIGFTSKALDLTDGSWVRITGPSTDEIPVTKAARIGDQVFTWGVSGAPGADGRLTIRPATTTIADLLIPANTSPTLPADARAAPSGGSR